MRKSCFLMLCACVAASRQMASLTAHKRHHGSKIIYPDEYLNHLGYMENNHGYWLHTREERIKSIKLYQVRNGLKVTGKIGQETWRLMTTPRCGVPDLGKGSLQHPVSTQGSRRRRKRQTYNVGNKATSISETGNENAKWIVNHVYWRPGKLSNNIPWNQQRYVFNKAFQKWSAPSKLKVHNTRFKPDVEINFVSREHGDGAGNAFDGRGMMLAHAFGPGNAQISGDIHFDADEIWTYRVNSSKTRDLLMIAMHEVGHSMGLPHSNNSIDVMYPAYLKYNPDPQLSRGDILKLRKLYGKDRSFKMPPKPKRIRKFFIKEHIPKWCRKSFNDVIRGPNRETFVFVGTLVYSVGQRGILPGYPKHVRDVFPLAPINTRAAVYVRETMKTYFFKGDKVWRYTKKSLDPGYPMTTKDFYPERVEFALSTVDQNGFSAIYLFGRTLMWRWNQFTERGNGRYYRIATYWRGLPEVVEAAVEWHDGYIYFFSRAKYYKTVLHRRVIFNGYPKFKGSAWFGGQCGTSPK